MKKQYKRSVVKNHVCTGHEFSPLGMVERTFGCVEHLGQLHLLAEYYDYSEFEPGASPGGEYGVVVKYCPFCGYTVGSNKEK